DLTARFRGERDKNVWAVLLGSFLAFNRIVDDAQRPGLEAFVRDRVGPAVNELGWEPRPGEDDLTGQLRGDLLRTLGVLGNDASVQARAAEVLDLAQREPGRVEATGLAAAIAICAAAGDAQRYNDFLTRFRTAKTPQEEQRYLQALAAFRQPELIAQTLDRTLNGEIRTQDAPLVLRLLFGNVHARGQTWVFVRDNWERIERSFPS